MCVTSSYLQNLPLVEVKDLLLEAVVAHTLHTHQTQDLDQRVSLGDAVLDVGVHLHHKVTFSRTPGSTHQTYGPGLIGADLILIIIIQSSILTTFTLSVSTPVMNSCSTVRLSKKASDAGTKHFVSSQKKHLCHYTEGEGDEAEHVYALVMSLMSSATDVWFASELLAACMCGS